MALDAARHPPGPVTRADPNGLPDFPDMALVEVAPSGSIIAVNEAFCRLVGRPREAVLGCRPAAFTHPDDVAQTEAYLAATVNDRHTGLTNEKRYVRGDGSVIWVRVTTMWLPTRDCVIAHVTDISDLADARHASQQAQARLAALVEHSVNLIFVYDGSGIVTDANPACMRLLGDCVGEALGTLLLRLVHPDDLPVLERTVKRTSAVAGAHGPITFRIRNDAADAWTHLECVANNQLANPAIRGVVINGLDVTEQAVLLEQKQAALTGLVRSLGRAAEFRDPYTSGHQRRVADLAAAIGQRLGLPDATVEGIRLGAGIHDIGKFAVPAEILTFPGRLSPEALQIVRRHCQVGHDILADIDFPWPIADIVLQHHERLDGSGYPAGLRGAEILLEAQIVAVADVAEAMTSHRPYRPAVGVEAAIQALAGERGHRLDPDAVDACTALLEAGWLRPVTSNGAGERNPLAAAANHDARRSPP